MRKILLFIIIIMMLFGIPCFYKYSFATENLNVNYNTYIQGSGWGKNVQNGEISGTTGQSLRMEAIKIQTQGLGDNIKYQVHIQDVGWQEWKKNGETAGTLNKSLRIEAIRIQLDSEEYSIMYRAHVQGIGWQEFVIDGQVAGTEGHSLRLEAIEIKIIKKDKEPHIKYKSHIQDIGWQDSVIDGEKAGTEGRSLRLEAIQINLLNLPQNAKVKYRAHIQDIGWQEWKYNGAIAGTTEKMLRLEAIQIKLENVAKYKVQYRVHIQDIGWSGWYSEGEIAGTTGKSKRLEAIQIRIVEHQKKYYTGIDVSRWQGDIDYEKLTKTGKVDFIIPRIGWYSRNQGKFIEDIQFKRNYREATSRKIPMGAYVYSYALSVEEAQLEAKETINYLKSTGQTNFDLPIYFDIEDDSQISLGKEKITQIAIAFCEEIKAAGLKTGIYSYSYWLSNYMNVDILPKDYSIWVADFGQSSGELPKDIYKYANKYDMWQYTDKGKIDGILEYVDINIMY